MIRTTSTFPNDTIETGDVFKVVYNETIATPTVGDSLRATDADSTVADITDGTDPTWTVNVSAETVNGVERAAGTVLTVELTAGPTIVTVGTTAGLQDPAMITDQGGTTDANGNSWDVSAVDQDVEINEDAMDDNVDSTDATAPSATDASFGGGTNGTLGDEVGDEITVAYDENVRLDGTATIIIDPDGAGGATAATIYTDGTNVSFSVSGSPLTVTVADATATDIAIVDSTSTVDATTNVEDFSNNAVDPASYPEVIN